MCRLVVKANCLDIVIVIVVVTVIVIIVDLQMNNSNSYFYHRINLTLLRWVAPMCVFQDLNLLVTFLQDVLVILKRPLEEILPR